MLSCFSLGTDVGMILGITACISSKDTKTFIILFQSDAEYFEEHIKLNFDAGEKPNLYRIDWEPDRVRFWAKGVHLHTISKSKYTIPNMALRIKLILAPVDMADESRRMEYTEYSMNVFRVRYVKFDRSPPTPYH